MENTNLGISTVAQCICMQLIIAKIMVFKTSVASGLSNLHCSFKVVCGLR